MNVAQWALSALILLLTGHPVAEGVNSPVITNLKFDPPAGARGSRVVIHLQIYDRQGRNDIVPVLHLLREGHELIKAPVFDDGRNSDRLPDDGFYSGGMTIPFSAALGSHWFVVYLFDRGGSRSNLLIHEFTVLGEQGQV